MPEVIGYSNKYRPQFIVKENDFPVVTFKVKGIGKVSGRNVYGFLVKEEEFKKISPEVCFDGWIKTPVVKYEKGEAIKLTTGSSSEESFSKKYLKEIEGGKFVSGGCLWMKDKLQELDIPIREIKIRHRLGWSFKT